MRRGTNLASPSFAPRRIAIIKPSALGDIVHALPVLSALRQRFPGARISWIVNQSLEALLANHPDLAETIPFNRSAFRGVSLAGARYAQQFANRLRRARFDCVIDLQGLLRSGLMTAATGAPVKIGFANAREGARHAYTHAIEVPDAEQLHAVDRYWRIAEVLGAGDGPRTAVLPVHPIEREAVIAMLQGLPRPWVAVAGGAKWLTKRWPPAHFATLLNLAHTQFGGTAILIGAPEDAELSAQIQQACVGPVVSLVGSTSLPRLVALLAHVDIMLANDTGPLHVAAALKTRCVAPYTCTSIVKHGPYGFSRGAVATGVPCAASYLKHCPRGMICFDELSPDRLWPSFAKELAACLVLPSA